LSERFRKTPGAQLHGDESQAERVARVKDLTDQEPYWLDVPSQNAAPDAIREVVNRQYSPRMAHVHTTHFRVLVDAELYEMVLTADRKRRARNGMPSG
jgi:hypothetical protein